MSNIQTGAERMPHDLSHLGFLAGQIGRLITISTTPVIAGDSFEMDAVGALRLSPLRRGLAIEKDGERQRRKTESANGVHLEGVRLSPLRRGLAIDSTV